MTGQRFLPNTRGRGCIGIAALPGVGKETRLENKSVATWDRRGGFDNAQLAVVSFILRSHVQFAIGEWQTRIRLRYRPDLSVKCTVLAISIGSLSRQTHSDKNDAGDQSIATLQIQFPALLRGGRCVGGTVDVLGVTFFNLDSIFAILRARWDADATFDDGRVLTTPYVILNSARSHHYTLRSERVPNMSADRKHLD
ncbi:hypothetical protein K438DRAFT_1770846 [Mycena galopus ATCC 62051]|nr:hypothetical protein K438DRAFT_1770846 [Mycena galopus ATCC 62051]